jgi:biopolymer transport protein ExbB/TolQ
MIQAQIAPIFADGALQFAFEKATLEGKITIGSLVVVSLFSWTVIFTKAWQLIRARKVARRFFEAYRETRDPLELSRKKEVFDGAPAYELYAAGAEELQFHLDKNAVEIRGEKRVSSASFDSVKVVLERTASQEALSLEKGMIVLSTAVAGGPFIGLLGTVWGVMETFSGIAKAASASLTAMAPGVAGALIATVVGLFVAIPAMFAYNFMVTTIRAITQELDAFATEYATAIEHAYVDNRPLGEEITEANRTLVTEIAKANEAFAEKLVTALRQPSGARA